MISVIPILSRLAKFTAEDYKVLKKKYEDTAIMAKTTKKLTPKECAWETIHIMILSYSRRLNALNNPQIQNLMDFDLVTFRELEEGEK